MDKNIYTTQSSLEAFIKTKLEYADKNPDFKFSPIESIEGDFVEKISDTNSGESLNAKDKESFFGAIKYINSTYSTFTTDNIKGVTPTNPSLVFEKQKIEFQENLLNKSSGFKIENGELTYQNPNLIKVDNNYKWISNPNKSENKNLIGKTQSNAIKTSEKINSDKFGSKF
jgi:hypothetical protein